MSKERAIVLHAKNASLVGNVLENATRLVAWELVDEVHVFCSNDAQSKVSEAFNSNASILSKAKIVLIPEECASTSKQKNFILKHFLQQGFMGFLHIIEDSVIIDDAAAYVDQLEKTMDVLDYAIHFSTVSDPCNYVFNKFNPRLSLDIDDADVVSKLGIPCKIMFTSNANLAWMVFNFAQYSKSPQMFDERFTIGMFIIIEFLASRKAKKDESQLYFMNQYLSIPSEVYAYHMSKDVDKENDFTQEQMKAENEIFKSLNINYASDNNLDMVLETAYKKIKSKL